MTEFLPPKIPVWATNANFPAGVEEWSGEPTKIEPSDAEMAAGSIPDKQVDAQVENYWRNALGRVAAVVPHLGMQSWVGYAVDRDPSFSMSSAAGIGGYRQDQQTDFGRIVCSWYAPTPSLLPVTQRAQSPMIAAWGAAHAEFTGPAYLVSGNGLNWIRGVSRDNTTVDANGETGTLVTVSSTRDVQYMPDLSSAWVTVAGVVPVGASMRVIHCSKTNRRLIVSITGNFGSTSTRIYTSDNAGLSWTGRNLGSSAYEVASFASNADGVVVGIGINSNGTGYAICTSSNNGNSWTVDDGLSGTLGNTFGQVVWNEVYRRFVILNSQGKMWSSPNGVTWGYLGQTPISIANGLVSGRRSFACVGSVLAAIVGPPHVNSASFRRNGVVYSLDLGRTWHLVEFALPGGSPFQVGKAPQQIRELGGRFVVGCAGSVYLSGPLWAPNPDIVRV